MGAERSKDERPTSGVRRSYGTRFPYDTEVWRAMTVTEEHSQQDNQVGEDTQTEDYSQQDNQVGEDDREETLTEEQIQPVSQAVDDRTDNLLDAETQDRQDLLDNDEVKTEVGEVGDEVTKDLLEMMDEDEEEKENEEEDDGMGGAEGNQ